MNTTVELLLKEALSYESDAFDHDEPIDGADLVEWFAEWRARAQATLDGHQAGAAAQSRMMPVCAACGSEHIVADAAARWNVDTQEWEVTNIFDKGHGCDACERSDVRLAWKKEGGGRDS